MGLDVYLYDHDLGYENSTSVWKTDEFKSRIHPEHMCNRRYLRSSYNAGGFNTVARNLIGRDLYDIFGIPGDIDAVEGYVEYDEVTEKGGYWLPTKLQLLLAKERAEQVRDALMAAPNLGVSFQAPNPFIAELPMTNEQEAIEMTAKAIAEYATRSEKDKEFMGGSYSNRDGVFHCDEPLKVRAIIGGHGGFQGHGFHVVYESDNSWYVQAAEVVIEFIDEALSIDQPEIHWSA